MEVDKFPAVQRDTGCVAEAGLPDPADSVSGWESDLENGDYADGIGMVNETSAGAEAVVDGER